MHVSFSLDKKDCEAFFLSRTSRRRWRILGMFFLIAVAVFLLFVFVIFPLIFMKSVALQRALIFTSFTLPKKKSYFEAYDDLKGYRNVYLTVNDKTTGTPIKLGVWHLLPHVLINDSIDNLNFDYDDSLKNSNFSVLLYFHGTGEARSYQTAKYDVLRLFFHVIAFDYRNYADSSPSTISEEAVVNDAVQMYEWVSRKTSCPVFIWGHSLGSALATRTAKELRSKNIEFAGLILESPFTSMRDELYFHPVAKLFSWLPWFEKTVLEPLERNGLIFDNAKNILFIDRPVMFFCAEDDYIVHYTMTRKLWEISQERVNGTVTLYYQFPAEFQYAHFFLYKDPLMPYFIRFFKIMCNVDCSADVLTLNETKLKLMW